MAPRSADRRVLAPSKHLAAGRSRWALGLGAAMLLATPLVEVACGGSEDGPARASTSSGLGGTTSSTSGGGGGAGGLGGGAGGASSTSATGGAGGAGGGGAGGGAGGASTSASGGAGGAGGATTTTTDAGAPPDAGCSGEDPPALDGGVAPVLAPDFAKTYRVFDLGPVPGVPGRLGGCVIEAGDDGTLLIAGDSESAAGAIYAIGVHRNACGHIIGWEGQATQVATTPFVDANLVYGDNGVLVYTQWNVNQVSQLLPGAASPAKTTDMTALGVPVSVSGLGFVPPNLPSAGQLRTVTWPDGDWLHLDYAFDGQLYSFSSAAKTATLAGGPGGFAYIPQGSPGFPKQSIIEAEWTANTVGVYEVDAQGDPLVATRRDFFTFFDRPWGAYFEPLTGDYLFLTWGAAGGVDRVYVVQGFVPPPHL